MTIDLKLFARPDSCVLITGPNGIGKSHIAKQIHRVSPRVSRPFITAHLASLSSALFESELFGHQKGAFTGATQNKDGYLDCVGGGTLFLDEVGEISLELQKKLLLLLEERIYFPVGSNQAKYFKGKIIAATNRKLLSLVSKGSFREDLFYRLRVFQIELEPLKQNPSQLDYYLNHFFERFKENDDRPELLLGPSALKALHLYSWPGNIREVKHCMEYIVTTAPEKYVRRHHLPPWILKANPCERDAPEGYHRALADFESRYLTEALEGNGGQINRTCAGIGISKSTLLAKVKKYGINVHQIKSNHARDHGI